MDDNEKIATVTSVITGEPVLITTTVSTTATITSTSTTLKQYDDSRKRFAQAEDSASTPDDMLLEVRDKIIIKGNKPAYAFACRTNQDYGKSSFKNLHSHGADCLAAIACLCAGIKAEVQKTITQLVTVGSTLTETSTSTSTDVKSTTTTTTLVLPTGCTTSQNSQCGIGGCDCGISTTGRLRICYFGSTRCNACSTDADCVDTEYPFCVWGKAGYCTGPGSKYCVGKNNVDFPCPFPAPFRRARREIETVFNLLLNLH